MLPAHLSEQKSSTCSSSFPEPATFAAKLQRVASAQAADCHRSAVALTSRRVLMFELAASLTRCRQREQVPG